MITTKKATVHADNSFAPEYNKKDRFKKNEKHKLKKKGPSQSRLDASIEDEFVAQEKFVDEFVAPTQADTETSAQAAPEVPAPAIFVG